MIYVYMYIYIHSKSLTEIIYISFVALKTNR